MSDSSDISSRSRVPVEESKSWPCSIGVDLLANLLFPLPSGPCPSRFSSMAGSGWTSISNIAIVLLSTFDSWFRPLCLKLSSLLSGRVRVILSTEGSLIAFLCFSGMNFLEQSLSLGILASLDSFSIYHFLLPIH